MRRFSAIILLLIFLNTALLHADFTRNDIGTRGAEFLKMGAGSRAAAMGNAQVGLTDDVNAIYWNPAGLNHINQKEFAFMHCMWFEEISYQYLAYAQPLGKARLAGSVYYLSMSPMDKYDKSGVYLNESFAPADMAIALAYANKIKKLLYGFSVKYISSKIEDESAAAYAGDIGIQYPLVKDKINAGLVLQNIGNNLKYIQESTLLPFNIKLGIAYMLDIKKDRLIFLADINAPIDDELAINLGAEYSRRFANGYRLSPRIGVRTKLNSNINSLFNMSPKVGSNNTDGELDGLKDVTAGLGFAYRGSNIDYAWAPFGELGSTHKFSIMFKFGEYHDVIVPVDKYFYKDYSREVEFYKGTVPEWGLSPKEREQIRAKLRIKSENRMEKLRIKRDKILADFRRKAERIRAKLAKQLGAGTVPEQELSPLEDEKADMGTVPEEGLSHLEDEKADMGTVPEQGLSPLRKGAKQ
ncbi:MAG: PorV/PorQ family protein [Elusimicrobiota bacterium]